MPEYTAELEAYFASINGHTLLQHKFHKAPLKIAKTFAREPQQIGICIMDCSPGLMAGDNYKLDWQLAPGSNVFITNQSYTKVHPSQDHPACQLQIFNVQKNARLEYKPEPIMLYKDASFRSRTEISLEAGAVVFFSDIICPGRVLRDEVFQYARYDSQIKIHYENSLIYFNRQTIEPKHSGAGQGFRRLGGWGSNVYCGSVYFFSDRITQESLVHLQALLRNYPLLYCGASLTYRHGIIVSALGESTRELRLLLDDAWQLMKSRI